MLGQTERGHDRRRQGPLSLPATLTVEKYLSRWLTDNVEGKLARASHDAYKRDVHYHIIPSLGRRKLKDLSTTDIRRFYRKKRDEGLSNRSLEYIHTTLRKALEDAKNDGIITRNPTDGVRPHKTPQGAAKESETLCTIQIAGLLSAASGNRWEALYVVALHTGLRRGEILGLRWEDVDLEEGTISVKRSLDVDGTLKTPKNPASRRTLKLTPRALAALKAHKVRQHEERLKAEADAWDDHNLVFPNTIGKPMNAGTSTVASFSRSWSERASQTKGSPSTAYDTLSPPRSPPKASTRRQPRRCWGTRTSG